MSFFFRLIYVSTAIIGLCQTAIHAQEKPYNGAGCERPVDEFYKAEVWANVAARLCLTCHQKGGDAEASKFVLRDPAKSQGREQDEIHRTNHSAFARMAIQIEKDPKEARLLLKASGQIKHGGEQVLKKDAAGYQILNRYVARLNNPTQATPLQLDPKAPPFFANIVMADPRVVWRRVTLSLAGRLPTPEENKIVARDGMKAIPVLLEELFKEQAFYDRIREGFNDIFLTLGIDGNADQTVLSYEHFEKTRHWYQKHDLSHIKDENERRKAGYKLADDYRKALLGESMKLIEHIVRHDRPITEIVTANYIMVSPYSARGYGVYEHVKGEFKNAEDPFEFIPVQLKALVGRNKSENQESTTGFYPHAGLLSTFQYLTRYPTTETNRNRLRARMYYQHFLGVDVLELAARVSDAAAVTAKHPIPTMQASECVVCHKTLDPVAGLFQDYWRFADQGVYGRRKGGWFTDMFAAGFEGEELPAQERWRSLQWLGERTARDPRFAIAMVEHTYYILTGRKVLLPPKDLDDPLFPAKNRAYHEQRRLIETIAERMRQANFNLKIAFREWIQSEFYRADGLATVAQDPKRRTELDDTGVVRLLAPEQVERKISAIFGERWNRLTEQLAMLYGGIDSAEVTERATDPSGAMGAIQRIMSNDVACKHVARDFARSPSERKLFPHVEPKSLPGTPESDQVIRQNIVHLHQLLLGRFEATDSKDVQRTWNLFNAVLADAKEQKGLDKREAYHCRQGTPTNPAIADDPYYTIRAWRATVSYLLRRQEFLYE